MNDNETEPIWDEASGKWLYEIEVSEATYCLLTEAAEVEGLTLDEFVCQIIRWHCDTIIVKDEIAQMRAEADGTNETPVV